MRAFLHLQGPTTYMQLVCSADQYANSNYMYYKTKLHNVTELGPKTVHVLKHAYINILICLIEQNSVLHQPSVSR